MNALFTMHYPLSLEPSQEQCFIAGYESSGHEWEDYFYEYQHPTNRQDIGADYGVQRNCRVIMTPTGGAMNFFVTSLYYLLKHDVVWVYGAGSNNYRSLAYNYSVDTGYHYIVGAGTIENVTGYRIETYAPDVVFSIPKKIGNITREGTVHDVASLQRSGSLLFVRFTGVPDVRAIGFNHINTPFTFLSCSGTDILPLPSGAYSVSYITPDYSAIAIPYTFTAGTPNTVQAVSSGTARFGGTDSNVLFVYSEDYMFTQTGWGIQLKNVTGFANNPNGVFPVLQWIDDGWYNKFRITFNVGSGTFVAGSDPTPVSITHTSSNAIAYVAGQLACIMDVLKCSSHEARQRLRLSGSNDGVYDTYSGYGLGNVANAIAYTGVIPPAPVYALGAIGTIPSFANDTTNYTTDVPTVANALTYNVYRDGKLYSSVEYKYTQTIKITTPYRYYYKSETRHEYTYQCEQNNLKTAKSAVRKLKGAFKFKRAKLKRS